MADFERFCRHKEEARQRRLELEYDSLKRRNVSWLPGRLCDYLRQLETERHQRLYDIYVSSHNFQETFKQFLARQEGRRLWKLKREFVSSG